MQLGLGHPELTPGQYFQLKNILKHQLLRCSSSQWSGFILAGKQRDNPAVICAVGTSCCAVVEIPSCPCMSYATGGEDLLAAVALPLAPNILEVEGGYYFARPLCGVIIGLSLAWHDAVGWERPVAAWIFLLLMEEQEGKEGRVNTEGGDTGWGDRVGVAGGHSERLQKGAGAWGGVQGGTKPGQEVKGEA